MLSTRTPASRGALAHAYPLIVLALVAAGVAIRLTQAPAVVTGSDPVGLLRSDPALIYYVTERIVASGGLPPADFRADPRIESPDTTDIPAMFTVGQEFLVAWSHLLLGRHLPLHVVAHFLMSLIASLAVVGVVGLTRELTGSRAFACLAGLLFVTETSTYRTLGSILVREDLSLPLFALHLHLLARALRVRSVRAALLAAAAAAAALATWHAMRFVFAIEVACAFAWWLRSGANPMAGKGGRIALAILAATAVVVPVLASKAFLLSVPMAMLLVMAGAPWLERALGRSTGARLLAGLGALAVLASVGAIARGWLAPGAEDYAHVVDMMLAKIRFLGVPPEDPNELSYGARLLWQGIFTSLPPRTLALLLGAPALLAPVAILARLRCWWDGTGDGREAVLAAFGGAALVLTLLVERLATLAGVVSPVLAVLALRSVPARPARGSWVAGILLVHLALFPGVLRLHSGAHWYGPQLVRQLRDTLLHVRDQLPPQGSVAADFVTSSAVLAHTGHPVVLQPKYETARSRERIARFTLGLYHEKPREFLRILREEFGARYLLIDSAFLWGIRYEAGLRADARAPARTSAAFMLLHADPEVYTDVPGYRFLYESPPRSRFRLYDLGPVSSPPP